MSTNKRYPSPLPNVLAFLLVATIHAACADRVVLEQQERTKVSIAAQNEHIQKLRTDIETARKSLETAESVIIFCWDEKVVDLNGKVVCKVAAGGYFTPENENNGQISGTYALPANVIPDAGYCQATRVSIGMDRYTDLSEHFSNGCRLVWAEQDRRRRVAADKPSPDMRHAAPVNDTPVQ